MHEGLKPGKVEAALPPLCLDSEVVLVAAPMSDPGRRLGSFAARPTSKARQSERRRPIESYVGRRLQASSEAQIEAEGIRGRPARPSAAGELAFATATRYIGTGFCHRCCQQVCVLRFTWSTLCASRGMRLALSASTRPCEMLLGLPDRQSSELVVLL